MTPPVVQQYGEIHVVRDDLFPGGTKARYIAAAFRNVDHVVYASPCEGGAQVSLALVAKELGKRVTIVCPKRTRRHPRTEAALDLGAELIEVGGVARFSVVSAYARQVAKLKQAPLLPFGLNLPCAEQVIAEAALACDLAPQEIWCCASSGTLARGLSRAWPEAQMHVVQVGHIVEPLAVPGSVIHVYGNKLGDAVLNLDFPSDPHYDAKAWAICKPFHRKAPTVFWNVMGTPIPEEWRLT